MIKFDTQKYKYNNESIIQFIYPFDEKEVWQSFLESTLGNLIDLDENNTNLNILCCSNVQEYFKDEIIDKELKKYIFSLQQEEEKKRIKKGIPLLSLLTVPLDLLHEHAQDMGIDHRIGILDHSIWHRALVLPAENKELKPTIEKMLNDWRLKKLVALENLVMLKQDFERSGDHFTPPKGHADTYKVSFMPRGILKKDVKALIKRFDEPSEHESGFIKKPIILIDDHYEGLRPLDSSDNSNANHTKKGKEDAIFQAFLEAFPPSNKNNAKNKNNAEDDRLKWTNSAPSPIKDAFNWLKPEEHFKSFLENLNNAKNDKNEPIILLDFLFSDNSGEERFGTTFNSGEERFGTTLIKKLSCPLEPESPLKIDNLLVPELESIIDHGPFAIFFASSFAWGVREELNKGRFALHAGSLYIDLGQDPVCYPEMFVKKFLQFLLSRETRPIMSALETIKKAENELFNKLDGSNDLNEDVLFNIFNQIGIMYSYTKHLEKLLEHCCLGKSEPIIKLSEEIKQNKDKLEKIHQSLGHFIYSGPQDCRVVDAQFQRDWTEDTKIKYITKRYNEEDLLHKRVREHIIKKLKEYKEQF